MTCIEKQQYTKAGALRMRNKLYRRHSTKLRAYECTHCGFWHLTSKTYMKEEHKPDRRPHRDKIDLQHLLESPEE